MTATLFDLPTAAPTTAADLDEWITDVTASHYATGHFPNDWARAGLASILGEEIPFRRWTTAELLAVLRRARTEVTR